MGLSDSKYDAEAAIERGLQKLEDKMNENAKKMMQMIDSIAVSCFVFQIFCALLIVLHFFD